MRFGPAQSQRSFLSRLVRAEALRWFAAFAMIPILILTTFGGTTLLAHSHDGHSTHFHVGSSVAAAREQANQHRIAHATGAAHCETPSPQPQSTCSDHSHSAYEPLVQSCAEHATPGNEPLAPLDESPDGLIISVPDQDPLASAPITVPQFQSSGELIASLAFCLLAESDSFDLSAQAPRLATDVPRQQCALPTTARIVSTSRALLL